LHNEGPWRKLAQSPNVDSIISPEQVAAYLMNYHQIPEITFVRLKTEERAFHE